MRQTGPGFIFQPREQAQDHKQSNGRECNNIAPWTTLRLNRLQVSQLNTKMNETENVDDASTALNGVRNEATIEKSDNSKVEQENEQEIEDVDELYKLWIDSLIFWKI